MKSNFFTKLYHHFFLSPLEKKMYKDFYHDKKTLESTPLVLIQCVEDYFYYNLFGIITKSLNQQKNFCIEQYALRNLTLGSSVNFLNFFKSLFFQNRFKDNKWIKLYSAYCNGIAYRHEGTTTVLYDIKAFIKAYGIYNTLKTKQELLSLVIDDIFVGDLIYDSYLRFKPSPTVDLRDIYLLIVIWQTLRTLKVTEEYFKSKRPKVLLTSYSTYIQHGIAVKIALKYNTRVFSFGNNQTLYKELTQNDFYHTPPFKNYKHDFQRMEHKEECLMLARKALENRLNGGIDIATSYMKESAYKITDDIEIPNVKDAIVVFLHDFFDSPHIYGHMVFEDFFEWVEFTIDVLEKNNIPYYLKPHPNQIGDSAKVIENLKRKYLKTKLISPKITNKQLVKGGIIAGISVYGTVAHELSYMGVPVILCGDNPHSNYDFCFEAKDKNEYEQFIMNHKSLTLSDDHKTEIESFYYMHNLSISNDMKQIMSKIIRLRNYNFEQDNKYLELFQIISDNFEFKKFISNLAEGC